MVDWTKCPEVERQLGKVGGTWLFRDTRVPVKALFENLEDGELISWPRIQNRVSDVIHAIDNLPENGFIEVSIQ
jgi:hypothetical protein